MTIQETIKQVKFFIDKQDINDDLNSLESIELHDKNPSVITILNMVNAIRKVQGTSKVYLGIGLNDKDNAKNLTENIDKSLTKIIEELNKSPDNHLVRDSVVKCITEFNLNEDEYYSFVSILSSLDLITSAGRSRTGGIKLYDKSKEKKAIEKIEQKISQAVNKEDSKSKHESVLYESASKEISESGFQGLILGSNRRLPGEWNTPDVMGYRIKKHKVLGGAELEIVTIEVKWEISKLAIAETNSHQKQAHKSFLMVHQEFREIDALYLEDLTEKGIGLICRFEDGHKIMLPAKENSPDSSKVDNFLELVLEQDEKDRIRKEMAKHFFNDFYKPLFPQ